MRFDLLPLRILLCLLGIALFAACNVAKDEKRIFNTDNLPLDKYTIDISRDTILRTKRGAIINIPAGSIEAKEKHITLELREAFSIADIVKAGLTTESNGQPLSSGGMIYINAAEEDGAKVVKPIAVSIPADYLQEGMQLYRGEKKDDGSINWTEPQDLQKDTVAERVTAGEAIFMNNCATCHRLHQDATGPALAGITEYRSRHFLNRFIRNSVAMIAGSGQTQEEYEEDHLAACIYNRWNKIAMTAFPNLTDEDLDKLYEYLENEGRKAGVGEKLKKCKDSCNLYFRLLQGLSNARWDLIADNDPRIELTYRDGDSQILIPASVIPPAEDKVIATYNDAVYYNFTIDAFGWYNIDMLLKENSDDLVTVKLTVTVEGDDNPDVFLVVPDTKIFQQGGYMDRDKKFAFDKLDGTAPLPLGQKAHIIAVSERDGEILFGVKDFIINAEQDLSVSMSAVSKQEFDLKLKSYDFDGLDITAQKTKNADSILVIDKKLKNLELLRPKNCDCGCEYDGYWRHDTAMAN